MRNKLLALFACICLVAGLMFGHGIKAAGAEQAAQGECVVEVSSRRILHAKNASLPLANASTTKIMTALVILPSRSRCITAAALRRLRRP